jgi:hypothetical protein
MAVSGIAIGHTPFFRTARSDYWWAEWLIPSLGLLTFLVIYPTWAVLQGGNYSFGNYLAPFASPELFGSAKAWFGAKPAWYPSWLSGSPAMLALWAPIGFRVTCYYYRGAYYKAFLLDPPQCTVGEPRHGYWGENFWPLLLQNSHRYFLYFALIFLFILGRDAWDAMWFADPATGKEVVGIGVGTLFLTVNVTLISGYTLGCHSLRSWIGGNRNQFSKIPLRAKCYDCVSRLNGRHMAWAWASLLWICSTDFYVRMCAMGVFHDYRVLF